MMRMPSSSTTRVYRSMVSRTSFLFPLWSTLPSSKSEGCCCTATSRSSGIRWSMPLGRSRDSCFSSLDPSSDQMLSIRDANTVRLHPRRSLDTSTPRAPQTTPRSAQPPPTQGTGLWTRGQVLTRSSSLEVPSCSSRVCSRLRRPLRFLRAAAARPATSTRRPGNQHNAGQPGRMRPDMLGHILCHRCCLWQSRTLTKTAADTPGR
eukprot:98560-Rhodomonas_salina.2